MWKKVSTSANCQKMAIQLLIDENGWRADVFRRGNAYLVIVNFGYDPVIDHTYSVMVGLEPLPGGGMEHFFCVIAADNVNGIETTYHSGLETANLLDKEARKSVLALVLMATRSLLNEARPDAVQRFTWDANAPEKALRKHFAVAKIMETCGYTPRTSDIYHGRYVWWAERRTETGVEVHGGEDGQTSTD
ncbi:hypothetical protein [Bradyrhizobium elkanii]|uniref:Uncharacterized protein n=1 Tax=Bradyrhizobium elkanii TaxID=29448 RepID=A0ABV4FH50_BRAEL|nr:hypothetical protein [Bradyrhizobium elkanii]MCP1754396.1 hypothetical protein [Bradyrhizobium elkanii]MCP1979916.1 hypothetical protein [Bradyrhizobium elkanii]MCS3885307.1 hypothetical protein [Bradyrhizobium elkanii]MCS4215667.1 hypothetical protein [Bradyrhizobium elkanii]MCW2188744.1 hypothetical protein [Bradyrhizobium elkanii]